MRHQRMAVFNFVAEVLTINLFNVVFIPAKCNHIVVVYKYKENKVRKNDNFPGSKIFGAKTFKIKRVNCIIFQRDSPLYKLFGAGWVQKGVGGIFLKIRPHSCV